MSSCLPEQVGGKPLVRMGRGISAAVDDGDQQFLVVTLSQDVFTGSQWVVTQLDLLLAQPVETKMCPDMVSLTRKVWRE